MSFGDFYPSFHSNMFYIIFCLTQTLFKEWFHYFKKQIVFQIQWNEEKKPTKNWNQIKNKCLIIRLKAKQLVNSMDTNLQVFFITSITPV